MKKYILIFIAMAMTVLPSCGKENPTTLTPVEFVKLIETQKEIVLLDVRTPEEFKDSHLPGAMNIDFNADGFVEKVKAAIPMEKTIAAYCRSGRRSAEASALLRKEGYKVEDLEGGILNWQKDELTVTDDMWDLYTTPGGKTVKILPLIHASLRIVFDGKEIEIDPVGSLGDRHTDYAAFPKADLIMVTHEHHDHLDPSAIQTLTGPDTKLIVNPAVRDILGEGTAMKNGDKLTLAGGIEIEAVPAYNTSADKLQFHPKGRDNGYVLTLDGLRLYIAGDTENIPEMSNLKEIDIAFLPCNLPYTMTPAQLIEAAESFGPKVVYPYHYGTTDLSSITPALGADGIYVRICPFDPE